MTCRKASPPRRARSQVTRSSATSIVVWDRNHISIEEDTDVAFTEDVAKRYESYGWDVQRVDWTRTGDYVEDVAELYAAIERAKAVTDKPSFIELRTIIGYPAPTKQNTGAVHGSKLGAEEVAATKELLGFDPAKSFFVEENVLAHTRQLVERGAAAHKAWDEKFEAWAKANPERAELYKRLVAGELPADYKAAFPVFEAGTSVATRAASGTVINAIADTFPELWGGSADLAGSNLTTIKGAESFNPASRSTEDWTGNPYGRVLHFGIREQAAAAIVNGIVLSSAHPRVLGHLLRVLRLPASGCSSLRADGRSRTVRVDPRLHRCGRRRPHPPADRAPLRPARHPRLRCCSPRGR